MPPSPTRDALDRAALQAALRARRAAPAAGPEVALLPGLPPFARGALHELLSAEPASSASFAAVLLGRAGGTAAWIGPGDAAAPWPAAPAAHGLSPDRLLLVRAGQAEDGLWAMEECLRSPAIGGAALAAPGALDDAAARRLRLAAAEGGALALLLRDDDAPPLEDAAARWRVAGLSGAALADPRWSLARLRGGAGREAGPWAVAWRAARGEAELDEEGTAALRCA